MRAHTANPRRPTRGRDPDSAASSCAPATPGAGRGRFGQSFRQQAVGAPAPRSPRTFLWPSPTPQVERTAKQIHLQIGGQVPASGEAGDLEGRLDRTCGRDRDRPVSTGPPTAQDAPDASEVPLCGYPRLGGCQTAGLDGLTDTHRQVERAGRPVLQIGEILQNLAARRPDRTDERHEGRLEEAGILPLDRHLRSRLQPWHRRARPGNQAKRGCHDSSFTYPARRTPPPGRCRPVARTTAHGTASEERSTTPSAVRSARSILTAPTRIHCGDHFPSRSVTGALGPARGRGQARVAHQVDARPDELDHLQREPPKRSGMPQVEVMRLAAEEVHGIGADGASATDGYGTHEQPPG